jgi:4a-hydroxytetrahydrobiopterin dehydratase
MNLAEKQCIPCRGGVPPLEASESAALLEMLGPGWQVVENHHLRKDYGFENFEEALKFTNRIGELAEAQNHHPDLHLAWGRVGVTIWTHKIDGLTESDFIFAAKCDMLPRSSRGDARYGDDANL